jgi:hypothetical protein
LRINNRHKYKERGGELSRDFLAKSQDKSYQNYGSPILTAHPKKAVQ